MDRDHHIGRAGAGGAGEGLRRGEVLYPQSAAGSVRDYHALPDEDKVEDASQN